MSSLVRRYRENTDLYRGVWLRLWVGQGTVAVELLEQVPDLDAILVSVSSGGLISGIALYAKRINPRIKVYACVPEGKMLDQCLKEEKRLWPEPPQFLKTKCEGTENVRLLEWMFFVYSLSFTTMWNTYFSHHVFVGWKTSVHSVGWNDDQCHTICIRTIEISRRIGCWYVTWSNSHPIRSSRSGNSQCWNYSLRW